VIEPNPGGKITGSPATTCVHELLHALFHDIFVRRTTWSQAGTDKTAPTEGIGCILDAGEHAKTGILELLRRIAELSCLGARLLRDYSKEAYMFGFLCVRHWVAVVSFMSALASFSAPLHADVFTNLTGPCCGGDAVAGSNFGSVSLATAFTPSVSGALADAQIVVFQVLGFGGDPHFNVSLFSDLAGAPGTLIEQFGTDLTAPATLLGGIVTAQSSFNPELLAGTQYWLVLTPFDSFTEIGWEQGGSQPVPTDFTTSPLGVGGWTPVSGPNPELQFQIDGVPEPASVLLLATAFGLIVLLRRKAANHPASWRASP
jgi:hypothetical protein